MNTSGYVTKLDELKLTTNVYDRKLHNVTKDNESKKKAAAAAETKKEDDKKKPDCTKRHTKQVRDRWRGSMRIFKSTALS